MGWSQRGKGRGRGTNKSFHNKDIRGGGVNYFGSMCRSDAAVFCAPPMECSPQTPFGGRPFFRSPFESHLAPALSKPYEKFPQKIFKRKFPYVSNDAPVFEIDLTKPWVTEEIKNEETKKQQHLNTWKISKATEDWSNFKAQKMNVQSLYLNAKAEYIATHPDEAALWSNPPQLKKLFCETCDKRFKSDDDLIIHESEHETCGRDGCLFTAHPKIILKHIKMQHDSGLYERIGVLSTKEDITRWIEERKKRYPTRKVVEEKKAMEEEKMNRGERIKSDNSRFNKYCKNRNRKEVKNYFEKTTKSRIRRPKKKKKDPTRTVIEEENHSNERRGVLAFPGIKDPCETKPIEEKENENETDNLNISDDEWETETKQDVVKPLLNNSLGLLADAYDSNEECNSEIVQLAEQKKVPDDEDSEPEEVPTIHRKSPQLEDTKKTKVPEKRKVLNKNTKQRKKARYNSSERSSEDRSLTLLEKLLKDEIRHERNVILQCVHYVVKNNFFKT